MFRLRLALLLLWTMVDFFSASGGEGPLASSALTAHRTIVVAEFGSSTMEPVLQDALSVALRTALEESPFLTILSQSRVAAILGEMGQPADAPVTLDLAREVCRRAQGTAYLAASIANQGPQYTVRLEAVSCQSGDTLAHWDSSAPTREKVLAALDEAQHRLRTELGELADSVKKFGTPVSQATTSSLEALQAWSLGIKARQKKGNAAAVPFFEKAVKLDPHFASAVFDLGVSYRNSGQEARAREFLTNAFALRERASAREKFRIAGLYYSFVTVQYDGAVETYHAWMRTYPTDDRPVSNLGSFYGDVGQYEQAIAQFREARRMNPNNVFPHEDLVEILTAISEFEKAKDAYREMLRMKLDDDLPHLEMYSIAFLQHDSKEMAKQAAWFDAKPELQHEILSSEADVEAYAGHLARARDLTNQAVQSAIRTDNKEQGAGWLLNAAWREALFGNMREAHDQTVRALSLAPDSREGSALAAILLARTGDVARATAILSDLEKRYPLHIMMQSYWLPSIRAQIALTKENYNSALQELRITAPYDALIPQVTPYSPMPSVVMRAQAYSATGQRDDAADQWESILKSPGIVQLSATAPIAKLQLARVYAAEAAASSSTRSKALAAYQDFLAMWKDADPDIPVLQEARAEFARLH